MSLRACVFAIAAAVVLLGAADASAARGSMRIDFEDQQYFSNGQGWETIQFVDAAGATGNNVGAIDIGFQIDFGDGPTSLMYINENGYVSFNDPIDFANVALAPGSGPIIAPYYADIVSTTPRAGTFPSFDQAPQSVSYTRGVLDLVSPFDETNDLDAIRINWNQLFEGAETLPHFQLVLYRDPDDPATTFGLEFNYDDFGDLFPDLAGFVLGSTVVNLALNDPNTVYQYSFSADTPTPVSEPGTFALFVAGLGLLFARYAWRRAPQPAR